MEWLNEPASWQRTGEMIKVDVDPGTDFWRETGYGYTRDSGHVYGEMLPGDLDVSVRMRASFTAQNDQAGIMLRADERTWLKTGLEVFEGKPRLSTVLTLGHSSWMMVGLPGTVDEVTLRASRRGDAVEVRYSVGDGAFELAALVYLPPGVEVLAGVMCAAPEGSGFGVTFRDLRIVGREWAAGLPGEPAGRAEGEWHARPVAGWDSDDASEGGAGWNGDPALAADGGWDSDEAGEPGGVGEPGTGWDTGGVGEPGAGWDTGTVESGAGASGDPDTESAGQPAGEGAQDREGPHDHDGEVAGGRPGEPTGVQEDGSERARAPVSDVTEPNLATAGPEHSEHAVATRAEATTPTSSRSEPLDPADEWISLLTGDLADD